MRTPQLRDRFESFLLIEDWWRICASVGGSHMVEIHVIICHPFGTEPFPETNDNLLPMAGPIRIE